MAFGCFAKQPIHSLGCLCFTFLPEAEQSILARSAREHIVWCRSPVSPPKVGCRSQSAFEYLILMGCPKSNLLKLHEQRDRPSSIRKPSFEHQTPVQPEMCLGGGGGVCDRPSSFTARSVAARASSYFPHHLAKQVIHGLRDRQRRRDPSCDTSVPPKSTRPKPRSLPVRRSLARRTVSIAPHSAKC